MDEQVNSERATEGNRRTHAFKLLMERGVVSAMGVGPKGIALIDLIESRERAGVARYRLAILRTRRSRESFAQKLLLSIYMASVLVANRLIMGASHKAFQSWPTSGA